ncbi:MAG: hypothetical protein AB7P20_23425, partial [Rhizobiaceae bacterium]
MGGGRSPAIVPFLVVASTQKEMAMFGPMHEIAARRGDGLRPGLRELLTGHQENVVDLSAFRQGGFR